MRSKLISEKKVWVPANLWISKLVLQNLQIVNCPTRNICNSSSSKLYYSLLNKINWLVVAGNNRFFPLNLRIGQINNNCLSRLFSATITKLFIRVIHIDRLNDAIQVSMQIKHPLRNEIVEAINFSKWLKTHRRLCNKWSNKSSFRFFSFLTLMSIIE